MKNVGNLTIVVNIIERNSNVYLASEYPKYIEIFRSDMKAVEASWLYSNVKTVTLEQGTYLVRITFGTRGTLEGIAEVRAGIENRIEFSHGQYNAAFSIGELTFSEGSITRSEFVVNDEEINTETADLESPLKWRDWNFKGRKWQPGSNYEQQIYWKRKAYEVEASVHNLQILEFPLTSAKSLFVIVPAEHELSVRERNNNLSRHIADHYKISIMLSNAVAQTLLSLITRGDMISARTLFNVKDAEILLLEKIQDPIAAAVGGYYLLKTGELEYMHNWANNLANWFEWLPDGCIIHAWQMILNKEKQRSEIKNRLLEAVNRGIPVFTEGLRLLYDGLTMLSYDYERGNSEVERALDRVKIYMKAADMSKEHTTLIADKDFLLKLI